MALLDAELLVAAFRDQVDALDGAVAIGLPDFVGALPELDFRNPRGTVALVQLAARGGLEADHAIFLRHVLSALAHVVALGLALAACGSDERGAALSVRCRSVLGVSSDGRNLGLGLRLRRRRRRRQRTGRGR